jgi:hypothetical protein
LDKKYSIYPGKFPCHTCKEEVKTIRVWPDTTEVTWMCSKKHISKITLVKQTSYTKRGKV